MEIRNLITFVQVAEINSFTKAANILGYSQSTISFQIKQLERELDCLLFERIGHNIVITDKGKELLEYARQIHTLTDEFNETYRASAQLNGSVHVAVPDSVCEDMMLRNYEAFHSEYPKISLEFTTADTEDMMSMIDHNEADVMLTLDCHVYKSDYVIAKEEPIKMNFVTGAFSEYAQNKDLSVFDISKFPFILTEKNMGYRRVFDETMAKHSIEIKPILEIGRTDIITKMLEKGMGVSFLPEFVTEKKVKDGKLVYLNVDNFEVNIWKQLIYHKNKWLTRSMKALIEYIKTNEFGRK